MMPTFKIRARETVIRFYDVEADTKEQAREKFNKRDIDDQAPHDADLVDWEAESIEEE